MNMKHILTAGALLCAVAATGCASGHTANNAARLQNRANRVVDNVKHTVTATQTPNPTQRPAADVRGITQPISRNWERYNDNTGDRTLMHTNPRTYAGHAGGVVTDRTQAVRANERHTSLYANTDFNDNTNTRTRNRGIVNEDAYNQTVVNDRLRASALLNENARVNNPGHNMAGRVAPTATPAAAPRPATGTTMNNPAIDNAVGVPAPRTLAASPVNRDLGLGADANVYNAPVGAGNTMLY